VPYVVNEPVTLCPDCGPAEVYYDPVRERSTCMRCRQSWSGYEQAIYTGYLQKAARELANSIDKQLAAAVTHAMLGTEALAATAAALDGPCQCETCGAHGPGACEEVRPAPVVLLPDPAPARPLGARRIRLRPAGEAPEK
jgi:hypothetical protein